MRISAGEAIDHDGVRVPVCVAAAGDLAVRVRETGVDDVEIAVALVDDRASDDSVRFDLLCGQRREGLRQRLRAGGLRQLEHVRANLPEPAVVGIALAGLIDRHVLAAAFERISVDREPWTVDAGSVGRIARGDERVAAVDGERITHVRKAL